MLFRFIFGVFSSSGLRFSTSLSFSWLLFEFVFAISGRPIIILSCFRLRRGPLTFSCRRFRSSSGRRICIFALTLSAGRRMFTRLRSVRPIACLSFFVENQTGRTDEGVLAQLSVFLNASEETVTIGRMTEEAFALANRSFGSTAVSFTLFFRFFRFGRSLCAGFLISGSLRRTVVRSFFLVRMHGGETIVIFSYRFVTTFGRNLLTIDCRRYAFVRFFGRLIGCRIKTIVLFSGLIFYSALAIFLRFGRFGRLGSSVGLSSFTFLILFSI